MSESRMMKQGCSVVKCPKAMTVQVLHEKLGVLLEGSLHGGLFGLNSYLGDKGLEPAYQIQEFDRLASNKVFIDSQKKIIGHMSLKECVLGVALPSSLNLSLSGYDSDDYTDYDESDLDYSDSEYDELPDLDDFDTSESDSEKEEMNDSVEVDDYDLELSDHGDELNEKHVTPDEECAVPDIPPHSLDRKNPVRGERGSSGKALRNIQSASITNVSLVDVPDPSSRKAVLASPQRDEWLAAEQEEMSSMYEMKVWELVLRRPGMNLLGNRMLHTSKIEGEGVSYQT